MIVMDETLQQLADGASIILGLSMSRMIGKSILRLR